jgi:hypothetical protein
VCESSVGNEHASGLLASSTQAGIVGRWFLSCYDVKRHLAIRKVILVTSMRGVAYVALKTISIERNETSSIGQCPLFLRGPFGN